MTLGLELGICQGIVYLDLKFATVRWDECQGFDFRLELLEQICCQAHGPVSVMSDCTIRDVDREHVVSPHYINEKIITYGIGKVEPFDARRPSMYNHFTFSSPETES